MTNKILWFLLSFSLLFSPIVANAQIINSLKEGKNQSGSEFYIGSDYGKPLMSIHIVSGVNRPGVYYVPIGTNLVEVFSYAGGSSPKFDMEEITVRRKSGNTYKLFDINFEEMIDEPNPPMTLMNQDSIYVERKADIGETLKWVSLVSGALTIILTGFLIGNNVK